MSVKHPCRNADSTSSLSSQLQQLFELPKKEFVYENFLCTLWQSFRVVGNLFLTENNLCFYGDVILGAKKKVSDLITYGHNLKKQLVIPLDQIEEIKKENGFGPTNNSLTMVTKSGQEFRFTRFADKERAFKIISDVKNGSPPLLEYDSKCDSDTQAGTPISGSYVEVSTGSIVEEVPGKIIYLEANKKASPPETHKVSLPISTEKFFEKFFADEAVFPYSKAMELSDAMDVQLSKWRASDKDSYQYMREMSMVVKVTGVPFKSKTRVQSTQYYTKNDDELKVHIIKKSLDIPYADSFHVEEYWTVKPEDGQHNQSILIITGEAVFSKSVTVEKIIKSRTQDALQKEHELWLKNTKDRDLFTSPRVVQTANLSFGSLDRLEESAKVETTILTRVESTTQAKPIDLNKRCFYLRMTIATMAFVILILLSVLMVMYGRLEKLESRVSLLENSKESTGNYYSLNQHYRK